MCAHWYIKGIQKKKKFERNLKKCPDIASSPSSAIELDVIYLFVVVVVSIVLDKISEFWVQTFLWYNTEIIDFFCDSSICCKFYYFSNTRIITISELNWIVLLSTWRWTAS